MQNRTINQTFIQTCKYLPVSVSFKNQLHCHLNVFYEISFHISMSCQEPSLINTRAKLTQGCVLHENRQLIALKQINTHICREILKLTPTDYALNITSTLKIGCFI